jgi:hypothetical protein
MKYCTLFLVLLLYACSQNSKQPHQKASDIFTTNDTIPVIRQHVNKSPVAFYIIPINNPLLKQYFGVKVYETSLTFQYLLRMQYEGLIEIDTLKLPNFGTWPIVQVKKGPEKMSCIIGFLDKKKQFKEYKKLIAEDHKLRLLVLRRYTVGVYSESK